MITGYGVWSAIRIIANILILTTTTLYSDMKVYFDTCSLQRPLDDKSQLRIALEAEAMVGMMMLVDLGNIQLISSEALLFETYKTPQVYRQRYMLNALNKGQIVVKLTTAIKQQANTFTTVGIKPLDALHLACAQAAGAHYFCTCDDKLLKQAKRLTDYQTLVVSPLELIEEITV